MRLLTPHIFLWNLDMIISIKLHWHMRSILHIVFIGLAITNKDNSIGRTKCRRRSTKDSFTDRHPWTEWKRSWSAHFTWQSNEFLHLVSLSFCLTKTLNSNWDRRVIINLSGLISCFDSTWDSFSTLTTSWNISANVRNLDSAICNRIRPVDLNLLLLRHSFDRNR